MTDIYRRGQFLIMINAKVSSGSIPEDVMDNNIDPELTEAEAHQVLSQLCGS